MSKILQKEWSRYGDEIGQVLPKLTATTSRKIAVSVLRESGANREDQRVLAIHMAHSVTTADRYYDKSTQLEARTDVVFRINEAYEVSNMLNTDHEIGDNNGTKMNCVLVSDFALTFMFIVSCRRRYPKK